MKQDSMVTINIDKNEAKHDDYSVIQLPKRSPSPDKNDTNTTKKEDNSAFLIICEQRDRFRIKAQKLEQTKIRIESKLDKISADNNQLKQENVELYAKIKFLESYNNVKKSHNIKRMIKRKQVNNEIGMKYENLYKESMNPFAQFRVKEKEIEWIVFVVGSIILSKRLFRLFTFIGILYDIK